MAAAVSSSSSSSSFRVAGCSRRARLPSSRPRRARAARAWRAPAAAAEKTDVLVVGSGGREHALAWRLAQSPTLGTLYALPGSVGLGSVGAVPAPVADASDATAVAEWCASAGVGLVVVGPEQPLVDGLVDELQKHGVRAFGPTAAAARLEGSKGFLKDILAKYDIPTAAYAKFTDPSAAKQYITEMGAPIVVKTDGLAAGKGVTVAQTLEEAHEAVDLMLVDGKFGDAGAEIVVEEFLTGEEASFFAFLAGEDAAAVGSAQDHKAVGDGDTGPNTGGMGAYSPASVVTPEVEARVMEEIIRPTARAMVAEGCPYTGVIFAGLMIDNDKGTVKLLEHNVRFGDPECQVLMTRLRSDLVQVLIAACEGRLGDIELEFADETALVVVVAAEGYPGSYAKGEPIGGLDAAEATGATVFHAGTAEADDGSVVSAGGRVLGVTATGADVVEAQRAAYAAVDAIQWPGGFCRRDIGWREVARQQSGDAKPSGDREPAAV